MHLYVHERIRSVRSLTLKRKNRHSSKNIVFKKKKEIGEKEKERMRGLIEL
jgi:hypothetical protein